RVPQARVALLDEVGEQETATEPPLRDGDDETQVVQREEPARVGGVLLEGHPREDGVGPARAPATPPLPRVRSRGGGLDAPPERALLLRREEGVPADLAQVRVERRLHVAAGHGRGESLGRKGPRSLVRPTPRPRARQAERTRR